MTSPCTERLLPVSNMKSWHPRQPSPLQHVTLESIPSLAQKVIGCPAPGDRLEFIDKGLTVFACQVIGYLLMKTLYIKFHSMDQDWYRTSRFSSQTASNSDPRGS